MQQETTSWGDTQKLIAFIVVGAFVVIILLWMFFPPHTSEAATAVLNTMVGTLGTFAAAVISFYFGSSRTSATKDQTIAALTAPPSGNGNGHAAPETLVPEAPAPRAPPGPG